MASSAATTPDSAAFPEPAEPTVARRVLILVMVVMGSTLYATTLLIASTLLPQMQGTMSATQDEIAWAMTFNILATAVMTPMTGWLANRFGRRQTMIWSVLLFTLTTFMCGAATSLESLILWRVLQGGLGAPVGSAIGALTADRWGRKPTIVGASLNGKGAGPLMAVTLTDVLNDGLSMVYSFFDPAEAGRSLGTFMILDHIQRAIRMGLPYVYLGYWVNGSRKMDYKSRFLPQERLMPDNWTRIEV